MSISRTEAIGSPNFVGARMLTMHPGTAVTLGFKVRSRGRGARKWTGLHDSWQTFSWSITL